MDVNQQNVENAINSIPSKLEETIKNRMDVLVSVDEWIQGLHKELKEID
jgi:hypothetical protein